MKIKILLIDDEPDSFINDPDDNFIPSLNLGYENTILREIYTKYFDLIWLQTPDDVNDFITLTNNIIDNEGDCELGNLEIIPEIVVFDYRLSTGWKKQNTIFKEEELLKILPTFRLANKLKKSLIRKEPEDIINSFYNASKITIDVAQDETRDKLLAEFTPNEDNMGCYAGALITYQFKNYPCIGIPTTSKPEDTIRGDSLYFEWILDKQFFGLFGEKFRTYPRWDQIIPKAVFNLRERIKFLIKGNKIVPSLSQVLNLINKEIPEDALFTFFSTYGKRSIPLQGLFIDIEDATRKSAITNWAENLISLFEYEEYFIAKEISSKLVKAYQSTTIINQRFRLSELVVKLCNEKAINENEIVELDKLKKIFGIDEKQINACINNEPANILLQSVDFRDMKTTDALTQRLIVLFTDLLIHRMWENFCELNKNSKIDNAIISQLKSRPTLEDLRYALFPIPKNPIILPYHNYLLEDNKYYKKDPFEVWESHLGKSKMKPNPLFPKSEYPGNLSDGEKQLCNSLALDIDLKQSYFPIWLMKK